MFCVKIFIFHSLLTRSVPDPLLCSDGVQGHACVSKRQRSVRPAVKWRMFVRHVCSTWNMVSLCDWLLMICNCNVACLLFLLIAEAFTWEFNPLVAHCFSQVCLSRSETQGCQLKMMFPSQMSTKSTTHRTWRERYNSIFLCRKNYCLFILIFIQLQYKQN